MSTLDVVADILREVAPRALKARQIAELAGDRLPTASRTPETVVSRDLAIDVRDLGAASRFLRVDRGAFVLKEALPTAFYNDNEPYAAQWTRNLVAAGQIAAGVVDERSIRDLKPADVASYRQCHFFSGIGVWSRALRDAGWPDEISAWTGSPPCQPWSSAGQRKGHDDDRDLWPEWFRLIKACRPAIIFGEQVASKDGICWFDAGSDLQRMQDREAVLGVLRGLGIEGGASFAVQDVLQTAAEGLAGTDHGEALQGPQEGAIGESSLRTTVAGAVLGETEGPGIHDHAAGNRSEDQARRLRADRHPFQSQERKDLGQSFDRSGRCIEGLHEGQCSCGAVLRERDGEHLGRGEAPGDCGSDREASERASGTGETGQTLYSRFGEELEGSSLEDSLRSVRSDLEGIGYTVWAIDAPACSVGAPHRRQRLYWVAYARERGREILSAPWLHDRGQRRDDAARCGEAHDGASGALSDAAGARREDPQDLGADRGDARESTPARQWWAAGGIELERGRDADDAGAVSDAERVVGDARRPLGAHGRSEVESDRHGQADGTERDGGGTGELGDACFDRAGEHGGELSGDEGQHEERPPQGDHASVVAGPAYRPGDRVRVAGDPTWGGAVAGFWGNGVEWIYCRPTPGYEDGCFRPAESGTQPLVDGLAPGMGRTRAKRLKGLGNAVVLPQAAVFVEAVIDAFVDAVGVME